MSKMDYVPDRAMQLIGELGSGLKNAVPERALKWVETGAALGALRTGTRVATRFVRRNPAMAAAAVAGAGLLWYAAKRRAKQAEDAPIEGSATRIEARRGNGTRRSTGTTRRRSAKADA